MEFIKTNWAQSLAWILTFIGGLAALGYFLEKMTLKWFLVILIITLMIIVFLISKRMYQRYITFDAVSNPFTDQGRIIPEAFFGREQLLREIFEALEKGTNLSLIGETQMGKSSLLRKVCQLGAKQLPNKTFIDLDLCIIHDEGDFFRALCDEIGIPEKRGYLLHRALRGKQYILCLDNIERLTNTLFSGDERTELRGLAEGAEAPLTLLIASRSRLDTLFPDSPLEASPLAGICQRLTIPPFSPEEVRAFIQTRLQPTGVQFTDAEIENIWQQSQGHPAQVQLAAAELYRQRE
jgi:hypothetical protein